MKKYIFLIILGVVNIHIYAQNKSITDSIHTISEIEIVAKKQKKAEIGKLNLPLQYMPLSVSSVSAKNLEMRGIVDLQEAVKFLPNTRMRTTYGAYQQFEVRGFDYTPIMIDGVRDERTSISNSAPFPDLSAIESIELLKGPASVLYGHSSVGGILNVVRKNPTSKTTVNALLSYGSWDNKRAMMDFGGKFFGPFNYRAVINWSDNEGYRYTNDKRFSGYFALSAQLDKKQQLDIRGGFNRDWYGTEIGLPSLMTNDVYNKDGSLYLSKGEMLPNLDRRARYNSESDFMINNGSNVSVKYSNKISEALKIENRLAYNYDNIDYFSTEQLSYLESGENKPLYNHYYNRKSKDNKRDSTVYICLDTVKLNSPLRFAYTVNVINNELEFSGRKDFGRFKYNYIAGYNVVAMFRDRYRGYKLGSDVVGPGLYSHVPVMNPHSMGYMDTHFSDAIVNRTFTHSVYLQNLLEFSPKLKAMVSGRYDYFEYWNAAAGIEDGKRKYINRKEFDKVHNSALTYRLGLVYLPLESLSVYGSLANYFAPYRDFYSETTIYYNADGNRFYPNPGEEIFKPQTGYQGEIGVRYSLNTLLQVTGSAYYIRKNNEKKTLATVIEGGVSKSAVGQIGSSESKGFELELTLTPTDNIFFSMGYGYTDATIRKFSVGSLKDDGIIVEETQEGMRLAGIPKNTFFAAANYTVSKGLLKNLGFTATVSYTDNVYRTIDKGVIYPAYWLTDLGASYKLNNGIQLRVNVNNVFDKEYYNQSLGAQMVPSTPRNFLFTLAYSM